MTFDNNTFFKLATGGVYTCVCIHNCVLVQILYRLYRAVYVLWYSLCNKPFTNHTIYLHLHDISSWLMAVLTMSMAILTIIT